MFNLIFPSWKQLYSEILSWARILGRIWDQSLQSLSDFTPLPPSKSGLKLFCNVNIVHGKLKSENTQGYAQQSQQNWRSWIRLLASASKTSHPYTTKRDPDDVTIICPLQNLRCGRQREHQHHGDDEHHLHHGRAGGRGEHAGQGLACCQVQGGHAAEKCLQIVVFALLSPGIRFLLTLSIQGNILGGNTVYLPAYQHRLTQSGEGGRSGVSAGRGGRLTKFPSFCSVSRPLIVSHRLNMELDLQSLFGLLCIQLYSLSETPQPPPPSPLPPHFGSDFGSYARALLASQDRQHLFVTPCFLLVNLQY